MFRFTSFFGYRKHSVARRRAVDRRGRFAVEILEGRQLLSAIATHTSVSASPATADVGQQVEFTATVMANRARKPTPTGRVQFEIDGAVFGSPVTLSKGTAVISDAALAAGSHTITAVYTPLKHRFAASTSGGVNETITPDATTTAVSSSASASSVGSTSNGGKQTITPDATTTAVSSSANPSSVGQPVTFTATVANASVPGGSTPTGSVQFQVDGATFSTPVTLSNGTAVISDAALGAGSHTITAVYQPDSSNFAASTSNGVKETITADATTTAVSSSANPSSVGQPVTFTATVANASIPGGSTPTGSVQFQVDGAAFGSPVTLSNGTAVINDAALGAGSHTITAVSTPASSNFAASTSSAFNETITSDATTTTVSSSASASSVGQPVTFTATVANASIPGGSTPTGSVQFQVDGAAFGSPVTLSNGTAVINDAALAVGSHTITAVYQPDSSNFAASTSTGFNETITADATTTAVSSSQNPGFTDVSVFFTATVANASVPGGSTPTGSVQFQIDGAAFGSPVTVNNGKAVLGGLRLSEGTHTITATFLPSSGSFSTSTSQTLEEHVLLPVGGGGK